MKCHLFKKTCIPFWVCVCFNMYKTHLCEIFIPDRIRSLLKSHFIDEEIETKGKCLAPEGVGGGSSHSVSLIWKPAR